MALFWRKPIAAEESPAPPDAVPAALEPREAVDAIPEPAAILAANAKILVANAALEALFDRHGCAGRTILELTRSAELSDAAANAARGVRSRAELRLPASGAFVEANLSPLSTARALIVLRDLSEAKTREGVRRDFIANASHELRTPVSAIAGAVETLLGGALPLDPEVRSFVEMIARHSGRLTRLTTDLLDLSRLESGQYRLEPGAIDVAAFCEAVLDLVRARAAEKRIALGYDGPAALRLYADRRAVEQILVNLLENAIKFTAAGGRVTLLADSGGPSVVLSVIDTGPGIEPRHRERVFERFYRADSGRSRDAGGTGLGLSIVKHLALAHGGAAGVESGNGGSRFWVRLPAARPV